MKAVGYVTVTLVVIVVSCIANGFGLSVLWRWFVAPTFGCAALSIPAAIGISLVFRYMLPMQEEKHDETWDKWLLRAVVYAIGKPLFAVASGFVVKQFM